MVLAQEERPMKVTNPEGPLEVSVSSSEEDDEDSQRNCTPVRAKESQPPIGTYEVLTEEALEQSIEANRVASSEGRDAGAPGGNVPVPLTEHVENSSDPGVCGGEDDAAGLEG